MMFLWPVIFAALEMLLKWFLNHSVQGFDSVKANHAMFLMESCLAAGSAKGYVAQEEKS